MYHTCYHEKHTNTHTNNIKITIIDIIKSIIAFIDNLKIIIVYIIRIINHKANNIKSICYAKIKSTKYLDSKKGNKYLDSIKSIFHDKIKSTDANNNITNAHKKVKWELSMLSKNKKITDRSIINTKIINKHATSIKYELNSLNKL